MVKKKIGPQGRFFFLTAPRAGFFFTTFSTFPDMSCGILRDHPGFLFSYPFSVGMRALPSVGAPEEKCSHLFFLSYSFQLLLIIFHLILPRSQHTGSSELIFGVLQALGI